MKKFDPLTNKITEGGKKLLVPNKDLVTPNGTKISEINYEDSVLKAKTQVDELKAVNKKTIEEGVEGNKIQTDYTLLSNTLVVKLFKHIPYNYKKEVYMYNPLVTPYQTEGGKIRTEESPLQYIRRGVVYAISDKVSEDFKNVIKVGDTIDLKVGIALQQKVFFPEPEDLYFGTLSTVDGFFMVNEHDVEKKVNRNSLKDYN